MNNAVNGVSLEQAYTTLQHAANILFDADPRVRSVGISYLGSSFGYRAVRNNALPEPLSGGAPRIGQIEGVPVLITDTPGEIQSLLRVAHTGPTRAQATTVIPEVKRHRPLVCGLQIQNYDDDVREGTIQQGFITIGTLGCFVELSNGATALLSNNHVIAGHNRGQKGSDRILQPGGGTFETAEHIAVLSDYKDLVASPPGAQPNLGNVLYNDIDAGVAELPPELPISQGYLPFRNLVAPGSVSTPVLYEMVFKVGRTTGLTYGHITDIATVVGPVGYDIGPCWFRGSFTIEGLNGTLFSDLGDSGSAIVRPNGEVLGILYAGNGVQTYACPIDAVFRDLNCTLA